MTIKKSPLSPLSVFLVPMTIVSVTKIYPRISPPEGGVTFLKIISRKYLLTYSDKVTNLK